MLKVYIANESNVDSPIYDVIEIEMNFNDMNNSELGFENLIIRHLTIAPHVI